MVLVYVIILAEYCFRGLPGGSVLVGAETTDLPPNHSVQGGSNAGIDTPYKSSFVLTRIREQRTVRSLGTGE